MPTQVKLLESDFSNFQIDLTIEGNDQLPSSQSSYFKKTYSESAPWKAAPIEVSLSHGSGHNSTVSKISAKSFFVKTYVLGSSIPSDADAKVKGKWLFQPLSVMNQLKINYQFDFLSSSGSSTTGVITLKDMDKQTTIFTTTIEFKEPYTGSYTIPYLFQTNSTYKLKLSSEAHSKYDPLSLIISTDDLEIVQESGVTSNCIK